MRHFKTLLPALLLTVVWAVPAAAAEINFDEFTSPPVTCCYGNPTQGVPVVYPSVTITGGPTGTIMNGDGWLQLQTSGRNLYGTLNGAINFDFTAPVSNLSLDVINGSGAFRFTVNVFDMAGVLLATDVFSLPNWGGPDGIHHAVFNTSGIGSARILGNDDFAVDTIVFDENVVPEPASLLLLGTGLGVIGLAGRRRRT